jgi:hypothetical protein
MPDGHAAALRVLEENGLIERASGGAFRTTRRWQGALARAALRLLKEGHTEGDLRIPMAMALVELLGTEGTADEEVAQWIEAILPIEHRVLH